MPSIIAMSSGRWCVSPAHLPTIVTGRTCSRRLLIIQAYDTLCKHQPQHADRHYVRVLHRASTTSESEVETAIGLLLEHSQVPTFDAVRDLVRVPQIPALGQMHVNLQAYDQLLSSQQRRSHG